MEKLWMTRLREDGFPAWFTTRIYRKYGHDIRNCNWLTSQLLKDDHKAGIDPLAVEDYTMSVKIHDALTLSRKLGFPLASIAETAALVFGMGLMEGKSIPWVTVAATAGAGIEIIREIVK